ncbi:MAG: phosphatase PAP2 family protein [Lachnospiraceae bacterium]|nr:phosphatase PAP2 family protein [Lachnospiraceae bacterium]
MKKFLYKYKHALALLYLPLYLIAFFSLESIVSNDSEYTLVECRLDDFIPFWEIFIIPYYLWFVYIAATFVYFFFADRQDFFRLCLFMFTGMTICLIIYAVWPNGHTLRPDLSTLGRDNIFLRLLGRLYTADTSTNVCPSIHTLNSIGACIAFYHADRIKKAKYGRAVRIGTLVLTISICLSTVFLKQHSILDVFAAMALAIPLYLVAYLPKYDRIRKFLAG